MNIMDGLHDEATTAQQMGWSTKKMMRLRKQPDGVPHIRIGRKIFYRVEAVREWMLAQETRSARVRRGR